MPEPSWDCQERCPTPLQLSRKTGHLSPEENTQELQQWLYLQYIYTFTPRGSKERLRIRSI